MPLDQDCNNENAEEVLDSFEDASESSHKYNPMQNKRNSKKTQETPEKKHLKVKKKPKEITEKEIQEIEKSPAAQKKIKTAISKEDKMYFKNEIFSIKKIR